MKSVDLALVCVFMIDICYGDGKNKSIVVTAVMRRVDSDIYYYNFSKSIVQYVCEDQLPTFMVEEKICRKNEDFFNGIDTCIQYCYHTKLMSLHAI